MQQMPLNEKQVAHILAASHPPARIRHSPRMTLVMKIKCMHLYNAFLWYHSVASIRSMSEDAHGSRYYLLCFPNEILVEDPLISL